MKKQHKRVTAHSATEGFTCRFCAWLDTTGLTHDWLATRLGVARSTVSHWASGTRTPNMHNLQNVADVFGTAARCMLCHEEDTRCVSCPHKKPRPAKSVPPSAT